MSISCFKRHRSRRTGPKPSDLSQEPLWNMVPQDILKQILERLPFRDALTCRRLSSCWASAVQASVSVEFVIPAKPQSLEGKIRRLQKTTSTPQLSCSDHRIYTFKLMGVISVQKCTGLLGALTQLVHKQSSLSQLLKLTACIFASVPGLGDLYIGYYAAGQT